MATPAVSAARRRWANVVIAGWIGAQGLAILRAVLPLPERWAGELPWEMFRAPTGVDHRLRAEVRVEGAWVEVPLERWFGYTRGSTSERVIDNHPVFFDPGRRSEREAFARWLIARLADDGWAFSELRLIRHSHDIRGGQVREHVVGRYSP